MKDIEQVKAQTWNMLLLVNAGFMVLEATKTGTAIRFSSNVETWSKYEKVFLNMIILTNSSKLGLRIKHLIAIRLRDIEHLSDPEQISRLHDLRSQIKILIEERVAGWPAQNKATLNDFIHGAK